MAQNVLKAPKAAPKPKQPNKVFVWLDSLVPFKKLFGNEFPVRYLGSALWLISLGIIVIGAEHNAERQVRNLRKRKEEVDNYRAAYTIMKASYMKRGKQSELAPEVAKFGLVESKQAPYRIVIKNEK